MRVLALLMAGVALIIATVACTPTPTPPTVPEWYYHSPCQKPADEPLEGWLTAKTLGARDLGLDCSLAAAYAEWLCEACGYDTIIAITKPYIHYPEPGHAWVIIEGRVMDPRSGNWDWDLPVPEMVFAGICGAMEYDVTYHQEWQWWVMYPELIKGVQ